ncbi:HAD-IA family hydrolase [Shimia marina]|uniref:?-D-glucose-1-phosphatase n=1 Tax=Shimia marina TaxID=321267 RepID=A0A0N7LS32_9RHOB|nr:HAD-IA family hydrolase [Shimia marina]CUH52492.1 ?-D-glucose-1-phosphatase [Shimia marina]SFE13265.1 2-haloacid dehalogenase [Shimia marina]
MSQIDVVIFDIGNVLIKWQPEDFYDRTVGEERRRNFFTDTNIHAHHEKIDAGASLPEMIDSLVPQYPEYAAELRMWNDNWNDLAAPAIPHSVHLLNALADKGVPLFTLTNFGHDNFPLSQAVYPFLTRFDREYVSGRLKLIKPDPAIYAHVEADSGIAPERLLFADDRADNIAAAAARGWQTHHFTTPRGWADRLVAEGLLTEAEAAWPAES